MVVLAENAAFGRLWATGKPIKKHIVYETLIEQDALVYEL